MRIAKQRGGKMSEQDAYQLAMLLIKAGYTVTVKKVGKDVGGGWIVEADGTGGGAA